MRHAFRSLVVGTAAISLIFSGAAVADDDPTAPVPDAPDAPDPTPERLGLPGSVAVLGDSISAGTGADGGGQGGLPGSERPENSWATGGSAGLNSVWQRTVAISDGPVDRFNLSENGRRSRDILGQVQGSPEDIGQILIQIGGNDLCRPTVQEMTPVEEYRDNIDQALAWIDENRPDALVQINAVPDIFRLWELRRSNFLAIILWGTGIIPCQSLLASPTSTSSANMARRAQVRERGLEYNDELRDACEAYVRCRYDDDATWLFSNDPTQFVSGDVSSQDYFHPSFQGQQKLAGVSWDAGFDFLDAEAPEVAFTTDPAPTAFGYHAGDVEVTVAATDDADVAGLEVRSFVAGDEPGAFTAIAADTTSVTVTGDGDWFVEARAIDINGNVSASESQLIRIDTVAPEVTLSLDTDANDAGWHASDVTVTATATDDNAVVRTELRVDGGDWVATEGDTAAVTLDTDGSFLIEARAFDVADNVTEVAATTVDRDTVAPTIDLNIADGQVVGLDEEVTVAFACDDERSGLVSCVGSQDDGALLDTSTPGFATLTVDAVDAAGNATSVSVTYQVVYGLALDSGRIDRDEVLVARNARLPVRVLITNVDGAVVPDATFPLVLEDGSGARLDAGTLVYDAVEDRYRENVSMRELPVSRGAYTLSVVLDDGTERVIAAVTVR